MLQFQAMRRTQLWLVRNSSSGLEYKNRHETPDHTVQGPIHTDTNFRLSFTGSHYWQCLLHRPFSNGSQLLEAWPYRGISHLTSSAYLYRTLSKAFGLVCSSSSNSIWDGRLAYVPALEDVLVWDVKKGEMVRIHCFYTISVETDDLTCILLACYVA